MHHPEVIFAEVRGKLGRGSSRASERLEDMLTSTVFGLLRYLPIEEGLARLLRCARFVSLIGNCASLSPNPDWLASTPRVPPELLFWPRWERHGEPDLLITWPGQHEDLQHAIIIEAKLYSRKSGSADEDDAALADPELPDPDQLVRYWQGLCERYGKTDRTVIYLTSHAAPPTVELAESLRREPSMHLAWLSWRDVWRLAEGLASRSLAAQDLAMLLRHKGLFYFAGFGRLNPPLPLAITQRFWSGRRWFSRAGLRLPTPCGAFWRRSLFRHHIPDVGSGHFFDRARRINSE
jgi:hypothetical protein